MILYLAIDTVFHPSGIIQNGRRKLLPKLFKICKNLNITLISVVHRLSNITSYDRVLVIGDGRILEDGKPLELLKKPMGFFSSLYRNSI